MATSSRAGHPWGRRPDPSAVAAALVRGIRSGRFCERDLQIVVHEAACVTLLCFSDLARRLFFTYAELSSLAYDVPAELFAGAPECPSLRRYLGDLVLDSDPDPMHLVRKYRRTVKTCAYNRFLEMIGREYPRERQIRRQIRLGADLLDIGRENHRLLFVPSRRDLEPISNWEHLGALARACKPGAPVRELLAATRTILEERTDVAGWIEIYDLVNDYLWFYCAPFVNVDWEKAPDDPSADRFMHECRELWLRHRDALREHCLAKWEGSPETSRRDFEAFCDLMDVLFETGRFEDRWVHWARAFPEEVRSNEEFRQSRHRRRADALWSAVREIFLTKLGPELGFGRF